MKIATVIFIVVGALTQSSFAGQNDKVVLQFNGSDGNGETLLIPSKAGKAFSDLVSLSSDGLEEYPCFTGSANTVLTSLEGLVAQAGSAVFQYSGENKNGTLLLELKIRNAVGQIQKANYQISRCK